MTAVCRICGRELVDWRTAEPNDPAMDCGGDCLGCMDEIEERMDRPGRPFTWRYVLRHPGVALIFWRLGIRLRDYVGRIEVKD